MAWQDTARKTSEKGFQDQIDALKAQVKQIQEMLREHGIEIPAPPAPEQDKPYKQPGVKW